MKVLEDGNWQGRYNKQTEAAAGDLLASDNINCSSLLSQYSPEQFNTHNFQPPTSTTSSIMEHLNADEKA
jgi:hypothetical protein